MKANNISINHKDFLALLNRSATAADLFSDLADQAIFNDNLIFFCNNTHDYPFTDNDFEIMCSFLMSSLKKMVNLVVSCETIMPVIYQFTDKLCTFSKYIALYWKNRFCRTYLDTAMTYLIIYPTEYNLSDDICSQLLRFYKESSLLETLCSCTDIVMNYSISESLLTPFMKKVRKSDFSNFFPFYLHKFNSYFFRHSYKIYPDECSVNDLYHGILSGYFSFFGFEKEAFEILEDKCSSISDSALSIKSLDNPLYVIWKLYSDSLITSIKNYSCYFELLFSN